MGESRRNDRFFIKFFGSKLLLMLAPFFLFAQSSDTLKPQKKEKPPKPKEEFIIINGNKYREHAGWVNAGPGIGYFFTKDEALPCLGIGYNFRFKEKYYKVGFVRTGNISLAGGYVGASYFFLNDVHIARGKRIQSRYFNYSYFVGGSYCSATNYLNVATPVKRTVGVYGEASAVVKPLYDLGIGVTAYGNLNFELPVIGLRLDVYFSGAFRGREK